MILNPRLNSKTAAYEHQRAELLIAADRPWGDDKDRAGYRECDTFLGPPIPGGPVETHSQEANKWGSQLWCYKE